MGWGAMDRNQARWLTALAVLAAVGLTAGAVTLGWRYRPTPPMPDMPQAPTVELPRDGASDTTPFADTIDQVDAVAERLAMGHPARDNPAGQTQTPQETRAETPTPRDGWRYLGAITGGGYRGAMISIAGRQRLVFEGETVEGKRLISLSPSMIIVQAEGGRAERIPKAERVGPLVGQLVSSGDVKPAPAATATPTATTTTTPGALTAEDRRRIIEQRQQLRNQFERAGSPASRPDSESDR